MIGATSKSSMKITAGSNNSAAPGENSDMLLFK